MMVEISEKIRQAVGLDEPGGEIDVTADVTTDVTADVEA